MCGTEQSMLITQTGNQIGSAFYLLDNFGFFGGDSSSAFHCNSICAHTHVCSFEKFRTSVLMNDLRPLRPLLNRFQSLSFHWIKMVMLNCHDVFVGITRTTFSTGVSICWFESCPSLERSRNKERITSIHKCWHSSLLSVCCHCAMLLVI